MPLLSGGSTVPPHRLALSTGVAAVLPTHRSSNTHATSRIARTGVEFAWGDLEAASGLAKSHAFGLRIGPVLGLGLGFRHLAALAELTVFIEHWTGEHANEDLSVTGVNLVPATALRILF